MTRENLIKLHKHYSNLVEKEFSERDFDVDYGDGGITTMEEMPKARIKLIKSDALRHKMDIERKYPWLKDKEEPKEEKKPTKSKGKKK